MEAFDVYQALKLPTMYEKLSTLTIIDEKVLVKWAKAKDPLERVLLSQKMDGEMKAKELASMIDLPNVSMLKMIVEPLDRVLGPAPIPSIEEALKMKLKHTPITP